MTNLVGTTLGQYQIIELIGEGGMASVYKAWQPSLRRYVALKVLAPHLSSDAEFVQRFHQEAVSAANLKHTNIVTIHDVGTESGYHYIAMEFIEGASLEERIRSGQVFALEQAVDIVSQIGSALDYAHQRGFIHRDIKPANILIDASGRAVLTDFGIVKALSGSGMTATLTRAGTVFGTPHYMSPEQVQDEPLDHRSDLYSLGIVCYEMLSGQVPFSGTTHSVLYAQVYTPPPPLHGVTGAAVPPPVEAVVNKMLIKERERRYNSAGEFARDLAQAVAGIWPAGIGGETVVAMPMGTGTEVVEPTPGGMPATVVAQPAQPPTPQPTPAPARRSRWPLVLGAVVVAAGVLLILGAVAWVLVLEKQYTLKSAQVALDASDYAQAVDGFSQVLENDPDNVEAMAGLLEAAANLAQAGQSDAAIEAYETVWQAKPEEVQALHGLGQAYEAQGEWEKAAGWYERWTQAAPGNVSASSALGNAHFNLGEYERAVAAYERAEALGASSAEMDTHLGLAYYELGEYEQAVAAYERAEALGASSAEVDAHLGLAYYELAQYDKAIEPLQNGVSQNPEDFQLQRALGVSLYVQDQPEQAAEHLNKAVALGADHTGDELMDVYYALGGYYFGEQDYEQAISFYEQAQGFDPEGQAIWADEARANFDEAYLRLAPSVMKKALLDLDFSNIVTEGDETYAVARTGQKVEIKGVVHLVDGPRAGSRALVVEEGTTNLFSNPSAETDTRGYSGVTGEETITRVSTQAKFGEYSIRCEADANTEGIYQRYTSVDNGNYAFSVWLRGSGVVKLRIYIAGWVQFTDSAEITLTDVWTRHSVTLNVTADHAYVGGIVWQSGDGTADFCSDGWQMEAKPYATTYCDGDQGPGYSWSGVPHASPSARAASSVSVPSAGAISGPTGSINIWWHPGHAYAVDYYRYLFDLRDGTDWGYLYWDYNNDKYSFTGLLSDAQTFSANEWQHVVVTWQSGERKIYVNGALENSDSTSQSRSIPAVFYIGVGHSGYPMNGATAEFAIFDHVLTAEEVAALYRVGVSASR